MNTIELRKQELSNIQPLPTLDRAALEQFWGPALQSAGTRPLELAVAAEEVPFPHMKVHKVTYQGFDHTPIHGWHIAPAVTGGELRPCVVLFQGYGGERGYPERYAAWAMLGYSVLAVDVRGQGCGETGNLLDFGGGVARGWVTQGITSKENSYYMAVAIDSMRAVEAAAQLPGVDLARIAVAGGSQGGGLALLAGALNPRVAAIAADIPNMCRLDYGVLHSASSLTEIAQYIKRYPDQLDAVLHTIAHFDIVNLAYRITAPVMMSVGWKDTVCMPETIYAAYNQIQSPKEIRDYPFSGHEVSEYQQRETMLFLQRVFASPGGQA